MPRGYEWITPTMLRTRYHERKDGAAPPPVDPARRPQQSGGRDPNVEGDAFTDWLGHLAAGRIEVR